MILTRLAAPAALPLSLAEVKNHLRLEGEDDDALVTGYLAAATDILDGPNGDLHRCLISQQWRLTRAGFCTGTALPLPPVISVDAVSYIDTEGQQQQLQEGADYTVYNLGAVNSRAHVAPAYGKRWPAARHQPDAVTIDFTAGFGSDWNSVPESLRAALKLLCAEMYERREIMLTGTIAQQLPAYEMLVSRWRETRL